MAPACSTSLAFCVFLIPRFGALGAAYSSLISYGACAVLALFAVAKLSRLSTKAGIRDASEEPASE